MKTISTSMDWQFRKPHWPTLSNPPVLRINRRWSDKTVLNTLEMSNVKERGQLFRSPRSSPLVLRLFFFSHFFHISLGLNWKLNKEK